MAGRVNGVWPGGLLGFALSGFFDGILLHQILQWHHLLSAVEGRDLRFQVAADGWFHALMYAIAAAGLWLMWRAHARGRTDGRRLVASMLVGFGAWHVLDAFVSHWILGIHRIRMDSADPLFWDLLWMVAFGLAPMAAGAWIRRSDGPGSRPSAIAPCLATLLAIGAGASALRPPAGGPFTAVVFAPGTSAADAFLAVAAVGGRIAWTDPTGQFVVFDNSEADGAFSLYARGAVFVGGSGLPSGCFGWTRLRPGRS